MTTTLNRWGRFGWIAVGACGAVLVYEAGRARAGVPTEEPLVYSGYLEIDGAPVDDGKTHPMSITLFDKITGGTSLCRTPSDEGASKDVSVNAGRFSVVLDDASCSAAVHGNTAVWVELTVDGKTLTPRSKIAAVPYALEADTATRLSSAAVEQLKTELKEEIKKEIATTEFAYPDCPPGYTRAVDDGVSWMDFVLCTKGDPAKPYDQIVKVGTGATSFWIDRYEATIWTKADGQASGQATFTYPNDDTTADFPKNGQFKKPLFALSPYVSNYPASSVTWFQAEQACALSGKRLPTGNEWLRAATGTTDPGSNDGLLLGGCNTSAVGPRYVGGGIDSAAANCVSMWGAEEMIGNFYEWVADWHVAPAQVLFDMATGEVTDEKEKSPWPAEYNGDVTYNIDSTLEFKHENNKKYGRNGLPSGELRGGAFALGEKSGLFFLDAAVAPTYSYKSVGFRCMIPR